jgi:hypothetical protein
MHEFHLAIRRCFDRLTDGATQFLFAPECGGNHRLPLYPTPRAHRGHAYCCVDGLGVRDWIRIVLEIEEEEVAKPGDLFGKFYSAAHCTHFIASRRECPVPVSSATFIQVVNIGVLERSGALGRGSLKPAQWGNIESDIQNSLSELSGRFCSYRLFWGMQSDFESGGAQHDSFIDYVRNLIWDPSVLHARSYCGDALPGPASSVCRPSQRLASPLGGLSFF